MAERTRMQPLPDDAWEAWSPKELACRLDGIGAPWHVVGGWALDLWRGTAQRPHDDLEFTVLRGDIDAFRSRLRELVFFSVKDGEVTHLPAGAAPAADVTQLWGADMHARCWRVDMMIEPGSPGEWVYKRDATLRMPRTAATRTDRAGISFLAPAIVLLFKARHCRPKDERDFRAALPHLGASERRDLLSWLERLHPDHDWIAPLRASAAHRTVDFGAPLPQRDHREREG